MRPCFVLAGIVLLTCFAAAPQAVETSKADAETSRAAAESSLKAMFEAKVKLEWEAIRNKEKKAYGELLADDYLGVEVDGRGERNKIQAINELVESNVSNYTLWGLKVIPLGSEAAFVIYEVTMQFPPRSEVRYSRVYIGELWVKPGDPRAISSPNRWCISEPTSQIDSTSFNVTEQEFGKINVPFYEGGTI